MNRLLFISLLCWLSVSNGQIPVIDGNDTLLNPWTGGINSAQFSNIDLNQDGLQDLFIFDRSGDEVKTFIRSADNQWIFAPEYISAFPKMSFWCLLVDINCDGKKDIFTSNDGGFKVYLNNSTSSLSFQLFSEQLQLPDGEKLICANSDIPSFIDVDNDGDIDILSFSPNGINVNYYQNLAIENGSCDNPTFILADECWGNFEENGNSNSITLDAGCGKTMQTVRHAGSSLLAFDNNNDGLKELVLGDLNYNNLVFLENGGSLSEANIINSIDSFPFSYPANVNIFPAGYLVDVNFDDINDLIVTPNNSVSGENKTSSWLYTNEGTNSLPDFQFQTNSFIQSQTIDLGTNAYPVLADLNKDGLIDLVVGNQFYKSGLSDISRLVYYQNIGTPEAPVFQKTSNNLGNAQQMNLSGLHPTFGDLDNDGDQDMIVGDAAGKLHFFKNTSSNDNPSFQLFEAEMSGIDVGVFAAPFLFDFDADGDLDLFIGERNGTLNYVENEGNSTQYDFNQLQEGIGNIDVMIPCCTGYSVPFLNRDSDNNTHLYLGSEQGVLYHYDDISTILTESVSIGDSTVFPMQQISPYQVDIDNNDTLDWFIGEINGGVRLYGIDQAINIGINNLEPKLIKAFPNPCDDQFNFDQPLEQSASVYNLQGQLIQSIPKGTSTIPTQAFPNGVYFLAFNAKEKRIVIRFVVMH